MYSGPPKDSKDPGAKKRDKACPAGRKIEDLGINPGKLLLVLH